MKSVVIEPISPRHAGGTFLGDAGEGAHRHHREGQRDESRLGAHGRLPEVGILPDKPSAPFTWSRGGHVGPGGGRSSVQPSGTEQTLFRHRGRSVQAEASPPYRLPLLGVDCGQIRQPERAENAVHELGRLELRNLGADRPAPDDRLPGLVRKPERILSLQTLLLQFTPIILRLLARIELEDGIGEEILLPPLGYEANEFPSDVHVDRTMCRVILDHDVGTPDLPQNIDAVPTSQSGCDRTHFHIFSECGPP
ncbi:MAG: hypothetical protein M5U07_14040 [Xanthobacteraceae bacterium]|nr:hypothetical protein [Xanthobacteraceae bacterium]